MIAGFRHSFRSLVPSDRDQRLVLRNRNRHLPTLLALARFLLIGMGGSVNGERTRKDGAVRNMFRMSIHPKQTVASTRGT